MQETPRAAQSIEAQDPNSELLWLLGQPHLDDFLSFVKRKAVGGERISASLLADQWRAANDLYFDLQQREAGAADNADCLPLPASLELLADELRAGAYYRAAYDTLPTTIEMIEIDKLIVSQMHIANVFSEHRALALGSDPTPEALFRFCLPLESPMPPVRIQRIASDRYLFSSESTDLRAHEPLLLSPEQLGGVSSYGPVASAIGLLVGFGSNFMSAIRSEGRLVLHNGYHRAYTLRSLGITHAPCIVETVTRTDELRLTANEEVSGDPVLYFRSARPPMLRDFFNPALVKRFPVRRMETMIEVEFKMRSWITTDLSD